MHLGLNAKTMKIMRIKTYSMWKYTVLIYKLTSFVVDDLTTGKIGHTHTHVHAHTHTHNTHRRAKI